MTQTQVLNILKEHKDKWFNVKEISALARINPSSTQQNVRRLRMGGEIRFKIVEIKGSCNYYYQYKKVI